MVVCGYNGATMANLTAKGQTQTLVMTAALEAQTMTLADRLQDEVGVLGLFTLVRTTSSASSRR